MNTRTDLQTNSFFKDDAGKYPSGPGVYLFKDYRGQVIYVGKAKVLRKRLSSYFNNHDRLVPKTRMMLSRAENVETICTSSEKEALLLEASLIKKHHPRYNIVLRDDKRYLLFRIDKSKKYPRIELTRKVGRDKADYFGPFTSADKARKTLKAINRIFPLRKCSDRNFQNRVRPCLQYHLQRCPAPCVYNFSSREYHNIVSRVAMFLRGKSSQLIQEMEKEMYRAADDMQFEFAASLRDQINAVRETVEKQAVVIPGGGDLDVLGWSYVQDGLCLGIIFVRDGKMLDSRNYYWPEYQTDLAEPSAVFSSFLSQFYTVESYVPPRIVLPLHIEDEAVREMLADYRGDAVKLVVPEGRELKELVRMAAENSRVEHLRKGGQRPALNLSRFLHLQEEPRYVECVDISHQSGEKTRAGKIVNSGGEFRKSEYRVYNLPDWIQGDDYAALREFVYRRLQSGAPWPDLLLLDGGKGQLNAVYRFLQENGAAGHFSLAAISKGPSRRKGELEDQVFIPGRKNPVSLPAGSRELLFLQSLRDEAHRFVVGRMRRARSKECVVSQMEAIPGVGPKKAALLRQRFGDLQTMVSASLEEIMSIPGIGEVKAEKIKHYLQDQKRYE